MGLFNDKTEGGILDVIRCDLPEYLVWKWRPPGEANLTKKENAIRYGSSLRVKDGEVAVFLYKQKDGTIQDFIVGPFDQTIKTANFPILTKIVGAAYGGNSPFQAEIYYINLSGNIQIKFGVPYFDIYDPRYLDFGVPIAVRGSITLNIADYKAFIKLNRLINFELDTLKQQIKDGVTKFIKGVVMNVPSDLSIPVVQIEKKILEINNWVHEKIKASIESDFGINIKRLDISAIEVDKESEGYIKLRSLTADITERLTKAQVNVNINTLEAQADVNIKNLGDMQQINAKNMEESLRIQREQMEKAQRLQTETANFETHKLNIQTEAQKEILKSAADSLGSMGKVDIGGGGGGGGMNPAGMITGMMMGGAMGGQMANMMNTMGDKMHQNQQSIQAPPPPPTCLYFVSANGQQTGPFNIQQMKQLAQNGLLKSTTFVWKQEMDKWAEASQLIDLQNILETSQPPSMPPPSPPPILP